MTLISDFIESSACDNYLQKVLKFGRELFQLSMTLDDSESSANQKMLRVNIFISLSFSLFNFTISIICLFIFHCFLSNFNN